MTDQYLILELTTRCNLDCRYCYNVWKEQVLPEQFDLGTKETKAILDNVSARFRIAGVTLAGGEPLLSRSILDICDIIHNRGIPLSITTNGCLADDRMINALVDHGVRHFEVSMPAVSQKIFEELCGKGNLKRVRASVLNIKKHNARCSVSAVITQVNFQETRDIIEIAAAFGADHFLLNRFIPGGRGKLNENELCLSGPQLNQALILADQASADFKIPVIVPIPIEHCAFETSGLHHLKFGTCGCGQYKWVVDPRANLRICEQHPVILGNLLQEDFASLISKKETEDFRCRNYGRDCPDLPCYENCGGGCRFAATTSFS